MLVTYKCISYTVIDMQVNVIIELETLLSPQKRLKAALHGLYSSSYVT